MRSRLQTIRQYQIFGRVTQPTNGPEATIRIPQRKDLPLLETTLLIAALKSVNARRIFEFGTYLGSTTLNLALNTPDDAEVFTFDLPPGLEIQQHPEDVPFYTGAFRRLCFGVDISDSPSDNFFMTPDEQRTFIENAKAYIARQREASERCFTKNKDDWKAALKEAEQVSQPDEEELCRIARGLRKRNEPEFWWKFSNLAHLVGWLRHRGRCVYCDTDLVEGQYIRHGWATTDHLLPKSVYPELDKCSLNTVPACSACNSLKGGVDPSKPVW